MNTNHSRYIALLRSTNVGGKNLIAKEDLKHCFENLGFTHVRTYIQSGNILFQGKNSSIKDLTKEIEEGLSDRFAYQAQAVVIPQKQYALIIKAAPRQWGKLSELKYNTLFLLGESTSEEVLAQLPPRMNALESVTLGPGVLFWSVVKTQSSKTTFTKLPQNPFYQQLTIRNHNTFFKIMQLFEEL